MVRFVVIYPVNLKHVFPEHGSLSQTQLKKLRKKENNLKCKDILNG